MSFFLALILAQAATAASAPAATAAVPTPPEDMRIVCRNLSGTGSRLNIQRVCLPKREWQRMWDDSRATTGSLQNNQSKVRDPSGR